MLGVVAQQCSFRLHGASNNYQYCCCANNVGSCYVRVGSGMQTYAIMLGPVVHCGKDTTHKTFETFVLLEGSNIVAERFGDRGTTEMLGVLGSKIQTFRNNFQQHATLCENGRNMLHPTMLGGVG